MDLNEASGDAAETFWRHVQTVAETAEDAALSRAADCVALGVAEMVSSGRQARWRRVAAGLAADPGPAVVAGAPTTAAASAALAANAFLMHAQLADDSYRLAEHPGLAVVPAALAAAELAPSADGRGWLRAIVGGYEAACLLADLLLPEASARGWRVTAAIAPVATAATACLVGRLLRAPAQAAGEGRRPAGADSVEALRIAMACAGGPLGVFTGGDAWRLQPALASVQGLLAARAAAAGARGGPGALEGRQGMIAALAGRGMSDPPAGLGVSDPPAGPGASDPPAARGAIDLPAAGGPRILRVTFKRHPVPMYGQALFDALDRVPALEGDLGDMRVRVPPFAAAYADQGTGAVTSVAAIARAALTQLHPQVTPPGRVAVEVISDDQLGMLDAVIEIPARGLALVGTGDTSGWSHEDATRHCAARIGDNGTRVSSAAHAVLNGSLGELVDVWRTIR